MENRKRFRYGTRSNFAQAKQAIIEAILGWSFVEQVK